MAEPIECPTAKTAEDLTAWRAKLIEAILSSDSTTNFRSNVENIEKCFNPQIPACIRDSLDDMNQRMAMAAYGTRAAIAGEVEKNATLKSEKDLPEDFWAKDAVGNPLPGKMRMPVDIIKLAKQKGWYTSTYKTRSTGGFDRPPNLFILVIPGTDKDIVMQIQLPQGGDDYEPKVNMPEGHQVMGQNRLTMITVDKTQNPPVGQLRSLFKLSGDTYNWSNKSMDTSNCMACHASPLRPISPVGYKVTNGNEKRMDSEQEKEVDLVNEVLAQDGVSWGKVELAGQKINLGPRMSAQPLGWAPKDSFTRKEEFVQNCINHSSPLEFKGFGSYRAAFTKDAAQPVNWLKVSKAMNCYKCHNGDDRGILHDKFSVGEVVFKTNVDRTMPQNTGLNASERLALVSCLYAEQRALGDTWKKSGEWLKKVDCSNEDASSPPNEWH